MPYLLLNFPMVGVKEYSGGADYAPAYSGKDLSTIASLAPADSPDHSKVDSNLKGIELCLCPGCKSKGINGVFPWVVKPDIGGSKSSGSVNVIVGLEDQGCHSGRGAGAEGLEPTDNDDIVDFFKSTCLDFIEVASPKCARGFIFIDVGFIFIRHYIIDIFPVVGARVADLIANSTKEAREVGAQVDFHWQASGVVMLK